MRYLKRVVALVVAAAALLVPVATASAQTAPGYEEWSDCRGKIVDPNITVCSVVTVNDGHLKMGSKSVPIVDEIKLVQQLAPPDKAYLESFDGGRQPVPGGLVGITGLDWLINLFPGNVLKLYAETELAGTPGLPLSDPVHLPIKVKLENPLLSNSCYIGSNSDPINLNLTTKTTNPPPPNQPITGYPGMGGFDPNLPGVLRIPDMIQVDNAFAAPRARGCTILLPGLGLMDPIVNLMAGLPSPAGTNETVQHVEAALAPPESIYPPDGYR